METKKTSGYACPRCTVGRCLPQTTTFADVYQGQLLSIPSVRAYICDVCHFAEYEQETLVALWAELYGETPAEELSPRPVPKRRSSYGEESS